MRGWIGRRNGRIISKPVGHKFSIRQLPEVALVHVDEVRLQVHKRRGQGVEAVVGERDGLGVLELGKGLDVEAEVAQGVVALGGRDVGLVRHGFARPQAHPGVVAALGDVVVHLPLVFLAAELAGDLGGEFVGQGQEDLGPEGLQQGSPGFARQRRAAS